MTSCDTSFEMLSAYVDGQLDAEEELEVRRHFEGCTRCRRTVELLVEMNHAVAAVSEVHPVPHGLRERLNELASSKARRPRKWLWASLAVAAALLVALGIERWAMWSDGTAVDQLARALVEDHVRYLSIPDAIQVASDNPQRIADSFNNRVGFPIDLPELSNASLLGARFCWLKGHKAVLSFYESKGQRFSLFALGESALPNGQLPKDNCQSFGKYEVCLLRADPELLAMVADRQQAHVILPQLERFGARQRPR
ncbi:MAG: anti-sigma factor family protein [Candidatus Binataceae bacterium]